MANRDSHWMSLALEMARRGKGHVEPNPMVGCVIVDGDELIGSGYHRIFGGPHAEVNALASCDPARIANATVYVTLEPCSHFGKTPPCADLLVKHPPRRVVIAMQDPFPEVSGRGVERLRAHSIQVDVGVLEEQAKELNSPYLKLLSTGLPWVVAKWAMTLDGAMATRDQDSKWISNEQSRVVVHQLRSEMDAILVGIGSAIADDPQLTTRLTSGASPARVACRVVLDRLCRLSPQSKMVQSVSSGPVLVVASERATKDRIQAISDTGCEVLVVPESMHSQSLAFTLMELGKRRFTNILIEGGGTILGHAFDEELVDEVHCFVAPKIVGGADATRPVAGIGKSLMTQATELHKVAIENLGGNIHVRGFMPPTGRWLL